MEVLGWQVFLRCHFLLRCRFHFRCLGENEGCRSKDDCAKEMELVHLHCRRHWLDENEGFRFQIQGEND